MIEKELIEKIEKIVQEKLNEELLQARSTKTHITVLTRKDIQKIFNCDRFKMNQIMRSSEKPPVVYIGRDYYSTARQMEEYFELKKGDEKEYKKIYNNVKKVCKEISKEYDSYGDLTVFHKEDLMDMFKMGKTKFYQFIATGTLELKKIGQEYHITEKELQQWFYLQVGQLPIELKSNLGKKA